eukprot:3254459-Heterocapsa_arctica.AAC.1
MSSIIRAWSVLSAIFSSIRAQKMNTHGGPPVVLAQLRGQRRRVSPPWRTGGARSKMNSSLTHQS